MMTVEWVGKSRASAFRRSAMEPRNEARPSRSPQSLPAPMILSIWFGLVTGVVELGMVYTRNHVVGWSTLNALQLSRHFPWMILLVNFVFFLGWGLLVGLVGRVWRRAQGEPSVFLLSLPACLAVLLILPGLYGIAYIAFAVGLALWVAWWASVVPERFRRLVATSLPGLAISICVFAGWKGSQIAFGERWAISALPQHDRKGMNVLFLVMDTVRADRLSLHAHKRDTAPCLNRIAAQGIRFDHAQATAPWTLPSHASMFTGLWPHQTGVAENRPLDRDCPTVAEFLANRGYLTAGFVANTYFCNSWFGLGRGFYHYEDFYDEELVVSVSETLHSSALGRGLLSLAGAPQGAGRGRKSAADINRGFLDWLSKKEAGRPFFVFLNYFDAHSPYVVPQEYERHFGRHPETPAELALLHGWENRAKRNVPERDMQLASDSYDDCIGYLDSQIGGLLNELERRGLLDNTAVVITSDHGEDFGEHGLFGHGRSLYSQELHVPLVIRLPGAKSAGLVVGEPVSLRDLAATFVDLSGSDRKSPFPGNSLARYWKSGSDRAGSASSLVFSEVDLRDKVSKNLNRAPAWRGPMQSIVADGKAYIRNADGRAEFYDLRADPTELHDLAGSTDAQAMFRFRESLRTLRDESRP